MWYNIKKRQKIPRGKTTLSEGKRQTLTTQLGKKKTEAPLKPPVEVFRAGEDSGLNDEQVQARARLGYINLPVDPPSKTVGQIVLRNVFT